MDLKILLGTYKELDNKINRSKSKLGELNNEKSIIEDSINSYEDNKLSIEENNIYNYFVAFFNRYYNDYVLRVYVTFEYLINIEISSNNEELKEFNINSNCLKDLENIGEYILSFNEYYMTIQFKTLF